MQIHYGALTQQQKVNHLIKSQHKDSGKDIYFSGSGALDSFSFSEALHSGTGLLKRLYRVINSEEIQSLDAIFSLPFSILKVARKAPKLLNFASGAEQDAKEKKKKETHYIRGRLESIEQQAKETNALLLERFNQVKETLKNVSNQLSVLQDAPLVAAYDQILSAQEALEQAHDAQSDKVRDEQMGLFRHQLLFAFNQLSIAKQTGSTKQIQALAASIMSKCAFMIGQPNTAVRNADEAMSFSGFPDPSPDTYYQFGLEALENKAYKQAEYFFEIGILKANTTDMETYNQEHLASAKGYRLASEAYEGLNDYPTAEVLARSAVAIDEMNLPQYDARLIQTYTRLGEVLSHQKKTNLALPYLEQALTLQQMLQPDNKQAVKLLAAKVSTAYSAVGRPNEAKGIY